MELKLTLMAVILFSAASSATSGDYVRPPPRKTLQFHWKPTHSSHPQQVHISLAGDKHMRITWITEDDSSPSVVEYGTSPGAYTSISQGESTTYSYLFYSSGKIHHTVIGPLDDNTTYFYRCGGEGPEFKLKTPPSQFPITFAVAGDLGQSGWTTSTLDHIEQCKYEMYLLPGDLSYADYQQHLWDTFGELVQPLASTRPWMVTQGNHEKERIPFIKQGFESYNSRWKMPFEESGSSSNLYYSFEVSGIHVLMLGSYTDYDEYSDQYAWLKADLAKVDRIKTPWLLAVFHVPWYNSNKAHQGEGKSMMASMEPLLYAADGNDVIGLDLDLDCDDFDKEDDGLVGLSDGEDNSGLIRAKRIKKDDGIGILGSQILELRDALGKKEDRRCEREFVKEEEEFSRIAKNLERDYQREERLREREERMEIREFEWEERQRVLARREFERRLKVEREFDEDRRRWLMKMEEKREEEEMAWRERMVAMQIDHEKQIMQMHADACQNQMQVLGVVVRLMCQFFGSGNDGLGGLGTLPPQILHNLQHQGGLVADSEKPDVNSGSHFM